MERVPQPQEEFETSFDREAVVADAADGARVMLTERIEREMVGEERFTAIVELMDELAEDNGNRFIVEAMAEQLSYEKKKQELQTFAELYPYAVAANDEEYEYKEAA